MILKTFLNLKILKLTFISGFTTAYILLKYCNKNSKVSSNDVQNVSEKSQKKTK